MTTVSPASLSPIGAAAAIQPDANGDTLQATNASRFEHALAQAPSSSAAPLGPRPEGGGQIGPFGDFSIDTNALTAADDAWVRFLAVSEQLQNPSLPAAVKDSLMKDLTANWRSFRNQSEPIIRQLDAYVASQDASLPVEPRT